MATKPTPMLAACVRRLARLQTTAEMKREPESEQDAALDKVILACREVMEKEGR